MTFTIHYVGCCGQESETTFEGDIDGLLREITWMEERGGWGITATCEDAGEMVYADGGMCRGGDFTSLS